MTDIHPRANPRSAVDILISDYNARRPLRPCVRIGNTDFETGSFLRTLLHGSFNESDCAPTMMRDIVGNQPNQLGPQAFNLAEAATAEGLLDPEPRRPGPPPHPFSLEAQVGQRPKVYRKPAAATAEPSAAPAAQPAPEPQPTGGMFAAQTSADEPAQVAEGPTRRSRKG